MYWRVVSTFKVYDNLPPSKRIPGQLDEKLDAVKSADIQAGKWVCIDIYDHPTGATGCARTVKAKHGNKPEINGWEVATRKVAEHQHGVFVRYTAEVIIPGLYEEHLRKMAVKRAEMLARKGQV